MNRIIKNAFCAFSCLLLIFMLSACSKSDDTEAQGDSPTEQVTAEQVSAIEEKQSLCIMSVVPVKPSAEDATGSAADDILGLIVYNNSDSTLKYAEIYADLPDGTTYSFNVTTLPPYEYCQLSNNASLPYKEYEDGSVSFTIQNIAYFDEEPVVHSDQLQISGSDGVISVMNVSENDIKDNIIIYYKDYENSMLTSGITYRVTIKDGLAAGEVKQVVAGHYRQQGSMIMFTQLVAAEGS